MKKSNSEEPCTPQLHRSSIQFLSCSCAQGRRGILKGLGSIGALSLGGNIGVGLGLGLNQAQVQAQDKYSTPSNSHYRIDTHHHFYPPEYQKAWLDYEDKRNIPHFTRQVAWTVEGALADMNTANVKKAMLSMASTPGVWFDLPTPEINKMVKSCNDYAAQMIKNYPGRFGLFATLTMVDVKSTLEEIDYAFDVLKAEGVGLQTNYGDKWAGHSDFAPIYEELNRRKALVYFHPLVASCCGKLNTGTFPAVLEAPHDTSRAVVNLLLAGAFVKYKNIRWLFSHAGGTIPMLAGRINYFHGNAKNINDFAPAGIEAELRKLFYDTANATHPASMSALLKLVPPTQVVYGSDYPYLPMDTQVRSLNELGLGGEVLEMIEHKNAELLLRG